MTRYVMDSGGESARLLVQERANPSVERLRQCGLRTGASALDVGCGPGAVLDGMLELVGPAGRVFGIEPDSARLGEARKRLGGVPNLELRRASLPHTDLPSDGFDFVWSQYVFEYLADPATALRELIRVARPGGKVVVAEIDGHGFANWPFPEELRAGLAKVERALKKTGFDLYAGRKMFKHFHDAGLKDVKVHLTPFYVVAGAAEDRLIEDWRLRFDALAAIAIPEFDGEESYRAFARGYLDLLARPDCLKYSVTLTTEGTKP